MAVKTAVPEPIIDKELEPKQCSKNSAEICIKFQTEIPHWGVMQSFQAHPYYDGMPASTLRIYDMGVVKRDKDGPITLSFQTFDTQTGNDPAKYRFYVSINFMAEMVDAGIDWPPLT